MVSNRESAVIFVDIEEVYSFNEDLVCKFILNHYTPQDGDRIAMFRLGWKSVKDYILFEWAAIGLPESMQHQVIFEKQDLPHNVSEIYQICYISSENVLHGATIPFQFQSEVPKRNTNITNILNFPQVQTPIELSSCKDILQKRRTKRENGKSLENDQSKEHQDCQKHITELKFQIDMLRRTVAMQQNQINILKCREKRADEIISVEEQKPSFFGEHNYDLGELDPIPPFPLNL